MVSDMKRRFFLAGLAVFMLALAGCKSAYYSTYEKFGVYKRDLLKKRIVAARDDQQAAGEQFKDALTRMKEMYGFSGGNLEKVYGSMQSDYDKSVSRADAVHKRIKDMEGVASDLFEEWEKEITQISTANLRDSSRSKLRETRAKYEEMHTAMKKAEKGMDPVLVRFHDQVLYLKHNLNAAAIASLKGESTDIQQEIGRLIEDMNASIAQADKFIQTMPQ